MPRIYRHPRKVEVPDIDLLTLLFESEHCAAQEDTKLHLEATNPSNYITKAGLRVLSEQFAHGVRSNYGIGAAGPNKDVVVVFTTGQPLAAAIFYGIIAAGGVFSAASHSFTPEELARQIKQGLSNLVVCSRDKRDIAVAAARLCGIPLDRVLVLESFPEWSLKSVEGDVNCYSDQRLTWKRVADPQELKESLIVLLYSSGTTGVPKGVMLSHTNLVHETYTPSLINREYYKPKLEAGEQPIEYRTLAHLPLAHIAGVFGYLISPMYSSGSVYWMPKFEWKQFLELNKKLKITVFYTVPSIFLRISKSPDVTDQFQSLELAITGAAPMDAELQNAANAKLGTGKNVFISQTWGLSETTGAVTAMPAGEMDNTGSISPVLPNMEMRLVDEDGKDVEPGQPGEVWVRGPLVTNGYFNNPEATRETFRDGWFCTGDIAVDRGGKFYIVDRKKELIKYKGAQVAPAEIENLLITHPFVAEAAVVGIPAEGTEVPRAYVVAVDRARVSEQELMDFVKQKLAPYKQLRGGVVFVDELPKNAIGKILRKDLRERARAETRAKL